MCIRDSRQPPLRAGQRARADARTYYTDATADAAANGDGPPRRRRWWPRRRWWCQRWRPPPTWPRVCFSAAVFGLDLVWRVRVGSTVTRDRLIAACFALALGVGVRVPSPVPRARLIGACFDLALGVIWRVAGAVPGGRVRGRAAGSWGGRRASRLARVGGGLARRAARRHLQAW